MSAFVLVNGENSHESEIEEGKKLVEGGINCDKLTDEQLEAVGEYVMEQMHPAEAHEAMHKMMEMEEDTEYHKQSHVNIAKMMYCGEDGMMGSGGMMGGGNMMGFGGMMGSGGMNMMGNLGYGFGFWNFINILYIIFLVGLIILVYLGIIRLWKSIKEDKGRK